MNSYDGFGRGVELATTSHGPKDYQEIVEDLDTDFNRPHFYEERHSYMRKGFRLDMDGTRRLLWWQTLAGGIGGFYGFYPDSPHPYPNPEQMRCVRDFWRGRFLPDMVRANELTDGLCLKTPDNTKSQRSVLSVVGQLQRPATTISLVPDGRRERHSLQRRFRNLRCSRAVGTVDNCVFHTAVGRRSGRHVLFAHEVDEPRRPNCPPGVLRRRLLLRA